MRKVTNSTELTGDWLSAVRHGVRPNIKAAFAEHSLPFVQVMHVGDRFTASGNDSAVRDCCSILWVANPGETDFFIRMLLHDIQHCRQTQLPASTSSLPQPACC